VTGFIGGTWSRDNVILFAQRDKGIMQVSASGGVPVARTIADTAAKEAHAAPVFLPDGRHFLYVRGRQGAGSGGVYVGSLDLEPKAQDNTRLTATGQNVFFVPGGGQSTGHLVFARDGTLMVQAFDADRRQLLGDPTTVAELGRADDIFGVYSASANGTLTYTATRKTTASLLWLARDGRQTPAFGGARVDNPRNPRLSPDGRTLAIVVAGDLWAYPVDGRPPSKLTSGGGVYSPVWSPDSLQLAFERQPGLSKVLVDGSSKVEPASP
jgi:hypothetical protein